MEDDGYITMACPNIRQREMTSDGPWRQQMPEAFSEFLLSFVGLSAGLRCNGGDHQCCSKIQLPVKSDCVYRRGSHHLRQLNALGQPGLLCYDNIYPCLLLEPELTHHLRGGVCIAIKMWGDWLPAAQVKTSVSNQSIAFHWPMRCRIRPGGNGSLAAIVCAAILAVGIDELRA